jgi:hypothetical protein
MRFHGDLVMFDKIFLRHPRSVGESYLEHMTVALGFAGRLAVAALAGLIHALVPALFERTASRIVAELYGRMVTNRRRTLASVEFDYAI